MKITILCSSATHPVNAWLRRWIENNNNDHDIHLIRDKREISGGNILFLVSCSEIITAKDRKAYEKTLVIHASDLPRGRGWSPHVWQIIEGATTLTVTLLEAADKVDSGDIWHQTVINVPKDALYDEINDLIFDAELQLMDLAVAHFKSVSPQAQPSVEATYYPKRTPSDSKIDPHKSIYDQFDLIRVCDPDRFPAFFELYGHKYKLRLEKIDDEEH